MKVDGITLLQMIKDGKIKDNTLIEVSGGIRTHYPYIKLEENKILYWQNEDKTINNAVLTDDILEYDFEIFTESTKPSFQIDDNGYIHTLNGSWKARKMDIEIIKGLNYLLKKEEDK